MLLINSWFLLSSKIINLMIFLKTNKKTTSQRYYNRYGTSLASGISKKTRGIIFDYEINVLSDHKNMVYAANMIENQRVMPQRLIIKKVGNNIQYIAGVENIVDDTIVRLAYKPGNKYNNIIVKSKCHTSELSTLNRDITNDFCFLLTISNVKR